MSALACFCLLNRVLCHRDPAISLHVRALAYRHRHRDGYDFDIPTRFKNVLPLFINLNHLTLQNCHEISSSTYQLAWRTIGSNLLSLNLRGDIHYMRLWHLDELASVQPRLQEFSYFAKYSLASKGDNNRLQNHLAPFLNSPSISDSLQTLHLSIGGNNVMS